MAYCNKLIDCTCLNNKICDTECFGYNVVICDLAIFFISIIYGRWIYPKYNPQAYKFRKKFLRKGEKEIQRYQRAVLITAARHCVTSPRLLETSSYATFLSFAVKVFFPCLNMALHDCKL